MTADLRIDVLMLLQVAGEGRTIKEGGGSCPEAVPEAMQTIGREGRRRPDAV